MLLDARAIGSAGGSGAPVGATYIVQTPNATLTNEQALSALATGILKSTTATGVVSIAIAGTDYLSPAAIGATVQAWDADLDTISGLAKTDGNFIVGDGATWVVESGTTARTSLGLVAGGAGDIWVEKAGDTMTGELTYAEPAGASHTFYAVDPVDANARLFNWNIGTSDNAGSLRDNVVINWGYNQAIGGSTDDDTEPAFYQQLETFYQPGGTSQFEYHWDFFMSGGADPGVRPMHLNCEHVSGDVEMFWYTDRMLFSAAHGGQFALVDFQAGATLGASLVTIAAPSRFSNLITFNQTTHAGIQLNSLTTTQKNALTGANGMLLYDSTLNRMQGYIASAWATLYSAGGTDVAIADGGTGQSTAQAAIDALTNVAAATDEWVLTKDTSSGNAIFKAGASGGAVAGSDTQIQFNDSSAFGADADLTWNKTTNVLTVTGTVVVSGHYKIGANTFLHQGASGVTNAFAGAAAGNLTLSGTENVGVGTSSLAALTTGNNNVGVGYGTLTSVTTGSNNVAIGQRVLISYTGSNAVAIGTGALGSLSSGTQSVAIGTSALGALATAGSGTAVGYNALISATGIANTGLGATVGAGITTGQYNTLLGYNTNSSLNSVSASIAIGANSYVTASNQLAIGYGHSSGVWVVNDVYIGGGVTGTASTQSVAINATGGEGTDKAGANITIAGGKPTGSGAGGSVILSTAPAGATGTALRALVTRLTLDSTGLITLADVVNFAFNTGTGTKFGTATGQKMGFWNVAPVIQPAHANQAALTNSSGGTYDGTLAAISGTGDDAGINNNFTDIFTLLDAMRTAMVNSGMMKGAA